MFMMIFITYLQIGYKKDFIFLLKSSIIKLSNEGGYNP